MDEDIHMWVANGGVIIMTANPFKHMNKPLTFTRCTGQTCHVPKHWMH